MSVWSHGKQTQAGRDHALQCLHHAAVVDVDRVLYVKGTTQELMIVVIIRVSVVRRRQHLKLLTNVAMRCLGWVYGSDSAGVVLGDDDWYVDDFAVVPVGFREPDRGINHSLLSMLTND